MTQPLISAAELVQYQADANLGLTGTCTILRKTDGDDGWGGQTTSYVPVVSNVPCSVVGLLFGSTEQAEQGRLATVTSFRINIPIAVQQANQINTPDRVQVGTTVYEIKALLADPSPMVLPLTLPMLCEKVS